MVRQGVTVQVQLGPVQEDWVICEDRVILYSNNFSSYLFADGTLAAKCARAHFTSKWSRPSHHPPQGRSTLLLRACTIHALGGEWREPASEDKLCVPVPRQAHKRTRAYVCNPMRSPGEKIPRKAGCRRERSTKRLKMEANIIAHAWLTPAIFFLRIYLSSKVRIFGDE
jgi:hypothetical protein